MDVDLQAEADAKKLWGALSALAERHLTLDEFGVLMNSCAWLLNDLLFEFLDCWEFNDKSYPIGDALPTRKNPDSRISPIIEAEIMQCKLAIDELEQYLKDDLLRISPRTVANFAKKIRTRLELQTRPSGVHNSENNAASIHEGRMGSINPHAPQIGKNLFAQLSLNRLGLYKAFLQFALQALTPEEFEQLCYLLIEHDGRFSGVNYSGARGSDAGKDIVAQSGPPDGKSKWVFQCKRYAKYSSHIFLAEIDKLKKNHIECYTLVFLTTQDISDSIINKVITYGSEHGYSHIEFWGSVKILNLLDAHPDVFYTVFGHDDHLIDDVMSRLEILETKIATKDIQKFVDALKDTIKTEVRNRLHPLEIGVGTLLLVFLTRLAHEALKDNEGAISRINKDKEEWKAIKKQSEAKFNEFKEEIAKLNESRISNIDTIKKEFIALVLKHDLDVGKAIHDILGHELLVSTPELGANVIVGITQDKAAHAEIVWKGFLACLKLAIVQLFKKQRSVRTHTYLRWNRSKCSKCGGQLEYHKFPGYITVTPDGTYVVIRVDAFICYKCERLILRKLEVLWDISFSETEYGRR